MTGGNVLELAELTLASLQNGAHTGTTILAGILDMAGRAIQGLTSHARTFGQPRMAAVGRLRGTGRGIHFRDLIATLERERPLTLTSPFEGSLLVAGGVWERQALGTQPTSGALAKLRWSAGADDLPMHVHDHSDRFIIVHEGRGFFHVSNQPFDDFDGSDVRSIPARERDVFLFTRGVVHTFSTLDQPMTLLSVQLPYMAFDDPRQYRLPKRIWTARENPERDPPSVGCDPAWTVLASQPAQAAEGLGQALSWLPGPI
jgi:mannose-6-phosphate isomerase-like protein (cupin superfamily)